MGTRATYQVMPPKVISLAEMQRVTFDLNTHLSDIAQSLAVIQGLDGNVPKVSNDLDMQGNNVVNVGSVQLATPNIISSAKLQGQVKQLSTKAITDPADSPANVEALRNDLVTNTLPSIRDALSSVSASLNSVISILQGAGIA